MATLTVQNLVANGELEATYAACTSGGDEVVNDPGKIVLHIKNGDASDHTATIAAQDTSVNKEQYGPLSISNLAVTVTAGEERLIGPFGVQFQDGNKKLQITYDAVTSVTIAALKIPNV